MKNIKIKTLEKLVWSINGMRAKHPRRYSIVLKCIKRGAGSFTFFGWLVLFVKAIEIYRYTPEHISEHIKNIYK